MPGTTLGSVHYFSPEQARGEMVTTASDVYSAGLVLFEMLTGRRAWTGDSAGAVAVARLAGDPPAPSSIRPGIPQVLDIAVRRALARVPADRPTAGDMAALLGRYIADPPGRRAASAACRRRRASCRRRRCWRRPRPFSRRRAVSSTAAAMPSPRPADAAGAPRTVGPPPACDGLSVDEDEDRGAGAWAWVAAILGVLVLFAGGGLLFLLLSRSPGPTPVQPGAVVHVPSFVGLPLADAAQRAERRASCSTSARTRSPTAPRKARSSPRTRRRQLALRGSQVNVTVATQKQTVAGSGPSPADRGRSLRHPFSEQLGAGQRSEAYDPDVPVTLVIRTNPRAGVNVARGTPIDYVVSLGPAPTPTPTSTNASHNADASGADADRHADAFTDSCPNSAVDTSAAHSATSSDADATTTTDTHTNPNADADSDAGHGGQLLDVRNAWARRRPRSPRPVSSSAARSRMRPPTTGRSPSNIRMPGDQVPPGHVRLPVRQIARRPLPLAPRLGRAWRRGAARIAERCRGNLRAASCAAAPPPAAARAPTFRASVVGGSASARLDKRRRR